QGCTGTWGTRHRWRGSPSFIPVWMANLAGDCRLTSACLFTLVGSASMIEAPGLRQGKKGAYSSHLSALGTSQSHLEPRRPEIRGGNHRPNNAKRYSWIGAALGLGAPIGLTLLRRLRSPSRFSLQQELAKQGITYSYLTIATPIVFSLFGRVLGRHEDKLRAS